MKELLIILLVLGFPCLLGVLIILKYRRKNYNLGVGAVSDHNLLNEIYRDS